MLLICESVGMCSATCIEVDVGLQW